MAYLFDGTGDHINFTKSAAATDLAQVSYSFHYIKDAFTGEYREIFWSGGAWSANFHTFVQHDSSYMAFGSNWTTQESRWSIPVPTDGVWTNDVWTYDFGSSANLPVAYRDGVSQTITIRANPIGTADYAKDDGNLRIGAYQDGSAEYWLGKIAEFAIWNRILTAAEAAILGKGYSPLFIPNGLVFYAPLIRNVPDLKGGGSGTVTNAAVFAHPRIIYPYGDPTGVAKPTLAQIQHVNATKNK